MEADPIDGSAGGASNDGSRPAAVELRLAIEHVVTRVLDEADGIAEASQRILRAVCETLGWACGARWEPDEVSGSVRCADTWGVQAPGIQAFLEATQRQAPSSRSGGLNRRAWTEHEPVWIPDVVGEPTFRRAAEARSAGLRGAFAFPIKHGAHVIGVMEFFSRRVHPPDPELLEAMAHVGRQIGQFIERTRAEQEQRRFRAAMDVSPDLVLLIEPVRGRLVDVNETACRALGYRRAELLAVDPREILCDEPADGGVVEGSVRRKDGTRLAVELTRRTAPAGTEDVVVVIARDIAARKREEGLLKLEHRVALALAEAEGVEAGLEAVIRYLCEAEGWWGGRYWHADEEARVLHMAAGWSRQGSAVAQYNQVSRTFVYRAGTGYVGRVWESGEPLWVGDIEREGGALRKELAPGVPKRSTFVFPVFAGGKTIGVVAFDSHEVRQPDERLLQGVRVIGAQIGQFVQRKRAEESLRASEARFRSLTELSSDVYWEQDAEFRFTQVTGIGASRIRAPELHYLGRTRWDQDYVNMTTEDWAKHRATLEARQPFHDLELCRLDESGSRIWVSVSGEPMFDAAGAFRGYRGVGKDITARKLDEERIQYLATHDGLTGMPNRAMLSELLRSAIESARRYGRNFAVIFVDLDRFKVINDTLGHEAGDALLKETAERLRHAVRASDVVARFGGDEFVVLAQEVNEPAQAQAVALKLLAALSAPLTIHGQECRVTGSVGVCMYPSDGGDEQTLLKNADIAMYQAKDEGKNTYKFYSAGTHARSLEKLALESSLRRALERHEFFLHYQAKLRLQTREITGVEALVRWQHPELGVVPPARFIPLAEETGLIVELGKWVLKAACAQNVAWQRAGLPAVRVSVNISARQFEDPDLLGDISTALESCGMAPELLELEITENMVMRDVERAARILAAVKAMGVGLAIDDFGVGYSSLAHLKRFPIDTLKVDRSFIRDIPRNEEDIAITEAIIAMARSLDLTVVAEGVETLEQHDFLLARRCDEMQGYLVSKPVPEAEFAELLRQRSKAA